MSNPLTKTLSILAGLALLSSGCGGGGSDPPAPRSRIVDLIVAGNAAPRQLEIATARALLIRRCMQAEGFGEPAVHPPKVVGGRAPILETGEFVSAPSESVALDLAREKGFAGPGSTPHLGEHQAGSQPPPVSDSRYWRALLGAGGQNGTFVVKGIAEHTYTTEGCIAKATNELYGNGALAIRAEYLPEDLDIVVRHDLETNPHYLAASRRWSACMASAITPPPAEPYALPAEVSARKKHLSKMQSHAYERKMAETDVRCQYSSGYIKIAAALKRRYAWRVGRPHEKTLATVLTTLRRATAKAKNVIGAPSG